MAISTYSELQTEIAEWVNRSDLTARIPTFISLCEAKLNRELRLRVQEANFPLSLAAGESSVALPDGFVEPLALWEVEASGNRPLRFVPPSALDKDATAGDLTKWSIDGTNIIFGRPAGSAVSLLFRMRSAFALSDAEPTNWLLTNYPDVYLYGSICEAEHFSRDDEAMMVAKARCDEAMRSVKRLNAKSQSGGTLAVETQMQPRRNDYEGYYW